MIMSVRFGSLVFLAVMALATVPASVGAQTTEPGYILGPDDSIQIIVYGQPEAGISTRIKSDGTIVMPLIGTVKVDGLTNIGLAKLVTAKLTEGGFLKTPVVNVEIASYVSKTVNVAGKVSSPGIVALDRSYRALEILLKAGWLRDAGATYVLLRRPGSPESRLDIEGLVRGEDDKNPIIRAGDTLFVPDADQFYVSGQVNRSGGFPIIPGMTVRLALVVAGGVTATGSSGKVGLIRGGAKEIDVEQSMVVQKNDVIVVKERLF